MVKCIQIVFFFKFAKQKHLLFYLLKILCTHLPFVALLHFGESHNAQRIETRTYNQISSGRI